MSDDPRPWVQTLATFPGIGKIRARSLADHCGSLAGCLVFLSTEREAYVLGIGPKMFALARQHLGLKADKSLRVTWR